MAGEEPARRQPTTLQTPEPPVRIGVSACLLGEEVRYDGGHKRDRFLTDVLGPFVEWVPVCPEVELGLGTPRETLRLVRAGEDVRLVMAKTDQDWTDQMRRFAARRVEALAREELCGYVLKKDSPSCGMERVKVYDKGPAPGKVGRGLFAAALMERFPSLPVEEEGRLQDARLRENFVERIFAFRRLRTFFEGSWTPAGLVAFHTRHKLSLLSHSTEAYRRLGRIVAAAGTTARAPLRARYEVEFMQALARPATTKRHVNVLLHMLGHLRKTADPESRRELLQAIEDYHAGLLPLIVPITLLRHHIRVHRIAYLADQFYLDPHPKELMLRNHV